MLAVRGHLDLETRGQRKVAAPGSGLDVRSFPSVTLPAGTVVFRIHWARFGPWWFSSDGSQRFDLPAPRGACYVAETAMGAFLETCSRSAVLAAVEIASRRLATITLKEPLRVADCLDPAAAGFGVTATTSAGRPYPSVSHPWARRFFQAGFDGVRYGVAHHPSLGETSFALFGPTGAHDAGPGTYVDDVLPDELVVAAKERFGFLVI